MNNAAFKKQYAAILVRAGDKAQLVVRQTAVALQSGLVEKSPVDTGRFKGNWQCGVGLVDSTTTSAADGNGAGAIARAVNAVTNWKPGQTIYLTNSLPYAKRLEFGWSQQAPSGMVRLTVADFRRTITSIAAGVRK